MSDRAEDQDGTTDEVAEAASERQAAAGVAEEWVAEPEPEPARSRRPSSLRGAATAASGGPRPNVAPPSFPSSPAFPGSSVQPPVSDSSEPGRSGQVPNSGPSLRERLPLGKLSAGKLSLGKLSAGKLSVGKLSAGKLSADNLPVDRLRTLVKQRPEVGLAVAFAGGLVIATILKRLGRR